MLPPLPDIETDGLSQLVLALAIDGWPNDQISAAAGIPPQKVENALRVIRARGVTIGRAAMNSERFFRLCWLGHIVAGNLKKQLAYYEGLGHPQPAVVATRRVGEMFGRSAEWVNAVANWHRQGIAAAKAELGRKDNDDDDRRNNLSREPNA